FAEMVTVGMLVPFIAVLADPSRAEHMPIIGEFLRWAAGSGRGSPIAAMAGLFVLMAIAAGAIRLVLEWTSLRVLFAIGHDVAVAVVHNGMHQPYVYHLETNSSEIIGVSTKVQNAIAGVLFPS